MVPNVGIDDIGNDEEVISDDNSSPWRRGIEDLRRLVSRRRLSRRILVVSIRHDYVARLRRAFLALKAPISAHVLSMVEQRYADARSWHRSRLLAMLYGLWVAYVQEEKQQRDLALITGAALFRHKSLRVYFPRLRQVHLVNEHARRRSALAGTYFAFLRLYEGLSLLKTRTAARQKISQHLVEKLELSKPVYRRRRLAALLNAWRLKRQSAVTGSTANALAVIASRKRSLTSAVSSWQSFVVDRYLRRDQVAYATNAMRSRRLVAAVGTWQRVLQQSTNQSRAVGVAVQHDGFLGSYRRCVKVMVRMISLMKRSLLRRRKVAMSDRAHKRHLVHRGWRQVCTYRAMQRMQTATVLKADFYRDTRKLSIYFQQLQQHHASQRDGKHALLKGVLIWKMSRLLTGIRRWHHWVLHKVRRRRMRLAARAGHAAEVATRACRMLFTVAAAVGGRNMEDRRRKLVVTTLKQWKRFTLRRQLEREKARQRTLLAAALERTRALGRGDAAPGRHRETAGGSNAAAGGGGLLSYDTTGDNDMLQAPDLLKAKPRPLTPFLVFQSSGSGALGSGLTCALGTTDHLHSGKSALSLTVGTVAATMPVPGLSSSLSSSSLPPSAAAVAVSGGAYGAVPVPVPVSASPWSSPVSVASSARFLSPRGSHEHGHDHRDDGRQQARADGRSRVTVRGGPGPAVADGQRSSGSGSGSGSGSSSGSGGGSGSGSGSGGGSGSGSGGGLGLAHAQPRKPSLLGCSLFDGLAHCAAPATAAAAAAATQPQSWSQSQPQS